MSVVTANEIGRRRGSEKRRGWKSTGRRSWFRMTGVMGEVMDETMEVELREGRRAGRTELRRTDEEEDELLKHLRKAPTETPGVPSWKATMTTGSHEAALCVNGA